MKAKKLKKAEKSKKTKLGLFQEVCFNPKSEEMAVLVLICAVVFVSSFLGSGKLLCDHIQEKIKSALSAAPAPKIQIVKSAVAAEGQTNIDNLEAEEEATFRENMHWESALEEDGLTKKKADKEARAKTIARQRAANTARILSGPVPKGKTKGLPDGRRVCPLKNDHPQGGGKVHIDEDCCPDYNETPNPRCYYSPEKIKILKQR